MIDYALGAEETAFWGGFLGPVLDRLASEGRKGKGETEEYKRSD